MMKLKSIMMSTVWSQNHRFTAEIHWVMFVYTNAFKYAMLVSFFVLCNVSIEIWKNWPAFYTTHRRLPWSTTSKELLGVWMMKTKWLPCLHRPRCPPKIVISLSPTCLGGLWMQSTWDVCSLRNASCAMDTILFMLQNWCTLVKTKCCNTSSKHRQHPFQPQRPQHAQATSILSVPMCTSGATTCVSVTTWSLANTPMKKRKNKTQFCVLCLLLKDVWQKQFFSFYIYKCFVGYLSTSS